MSSRLYSSKKKKIPPIENVPIRTTRIPDNYSFNIKRKYRKIRELTPPFKIDTLSDLIDIAWNYTGDAFDWFKLWKMIPILEKLNKCIGMANVKTAIVDMILYYIQGLHKSNLSQDGEMHHTVLQGSPGVGKTMLAFILAEIYCSLGIVPTSNVISVKRHDLVGKYIGHSEAQTKEILDKAIGGVLFIDEAYSLGCDDKTDSFAKSVVDLLNQYLSERKGEFICIIAGYEAELNDHFFSINPGLKRRFPWVFTLDEYTGKELSQIFIMKIKESEWKLQDDVKITLENFFEKNRKMFPHYGGDIENYFNRVKIAHTRRIFGTVEPQKLLSISDLEIGLKMFALTQQKISKEKPPPDGMYT